MFLLTLMLLHTNYNTCHKLKNFIELWGNTSFSCKQKMYSLDHRWHTQALRVHERELLSNCHYSSYHEVYEDLLLESKKIEEDMIISLYGTGCLVLV